MFIEFNFSVRHVAFHAKGNYIGTVCPNAANNYDQVYIHLLSKGASQRPFSKSKTKILKIDFHPIKPILFIMTQRNVYVYNLQQQSLSKKLIPGAVMNSEGYNVLVGTSDQKVMWFGLDHDDSHTRP